MKIINIEIKKIGIGKFYPKENKVEVNINFNDGTDKNIFKIIDISNPENAADNVLKDIRKLEKSIHKNGENNGSIVDNFVNIIITDEDSVLIEISDFIQKAKSRIDEIKTKNVAEGYLDMVRELKNLKVEF